MGRGVFGSFSYSVLVGSFIGLVASPVVIHLLNRMRFRKRRWAAMEFLFQAKKKSHFILTIKDIILLAVRVLALLLLILALARLVYHRQGTARASGSRSQGVYRVIVLDCSGSMTRVSAPDHGKTAFESARAAALKLVDELGADDSGAVVLMKNPPEIFPRDSALSTPEVMRNILGDIRPTDCAADASAALSVAYRLVSENGTRFPRQEIFILSDMQASTFSGTGGEMRRLDPQAAAPIITMHADPLTISAPVVYLVGPFAVFKGRNVSVSNIVLEEKRIVAGREAAFHVDVTNHGLVDEHNLELVIDVMGNTPARVPVDDIAPGQTRVVSFSTVFPEEGAAALKVVVARRDGLRDGDGFRNDDQIVFAVNVRKPGRVLLVDGDRRAEPLKSELDFLNTLLAAEKILARTGRKQEPSEFDPLVISDMELGDKQLADYDLVVLGNVSIIPPGMARRLADYVRNGGGLLVTVGENFDGSMYKMLDPDGNLLPAEYAGMIQDDVPTQLDAASGDAEFLDPFRTSKQMRLEDVAIRKRQDVTIPPGAAVRTLVSFSDGKPALLERVVGRGRSCLWLTTIDEEWNDFIKNTQAYAVFFYRLSARLMRHTVDRRNAEVGGMLRVELPLGLPRSADQAQLDAIRIKFNDSVMRRVNTVGGGAGMVYKLPLDIRRFDSGAEPNITDNPPGGKSIELIGGRLRNAGLFEMKLRGDAFSEVARALGVDRILFGVWPDAAESDLTAVKPDILADMVKKFLRNPTGDRESASVHNDPVVIVVDPARDAGDDALIDAGASGSRLWRTLMLICAPLFFIEQLLAMMFGDYEGRLAAVLSGAARRIVEVVKS